MNTSFLDSRTMQLLLLVFGLAITVVVASAAYYYATGKEPPFVRELFALLGGGGIAGTARNIVSDSPARVAQAEVIKAEAEVKRAEADVMKAQAGIGSYVPPTIERNENDPANSVS